MRIIISGGNGFIGKFLKASLEEAGDEVEEVLAVDEPVAVEVAFNE